MAKGASTFPVAGVRLDAGSNTPLHRQLHEALRGAILNGQVRGGTRLPSTRTLAHELGVSRKTVLAAFDQLHSEGCIESRPGSGTYAALSVAVSRAGRVPHSTGVRATGPAGELPAARRRELRLIEACCPTSTDSGSCLPFRVGIPALDAFPFEAWRKALLRRWQKPPREVFFYSSAEPRDYEPLQRAVADYLRVARGVRCEPAQVLMCAGTQQALHLAASILLRRGDDVWVEDPGYPGARNAFRAAHARVVPVPVDDHGIDVLAAPRRHSRPRMLFVTPSNQYPLGVTMSLERRLQVLEWARQSRTWILEDDYASEFRYVGWPVAALQGLDRDNRVIYFGSFSKALLPALRLSYMVVPPELLETFLTARTLIGHRPTVEQAAMADFIADGQFARHIRRMRRLYAQRQAALARAADAHWQGLLDLKRTEGGLHLVAWLPPGVDDRLAAAAAADHGVDTVPLSACCVRSPRRGGFVLGFGAHSEEAMATAAERLALALRPLCAPSPRR